MSAEKTIGIVLRVIEFSESSCIVTLMTRDYGKITVLAKGARRRKSPFEGALDLLSISRIVFLHKKSEALDLLTEAKLERRFRSAALNLDRLYAGFYVVELLAAMTDEGDPHPMLYELAEETIEHMDTGSDLVRTLIRFELGSLNLLGHRPMLDHCVGCGRAKAAENIAVHFGLKAGGIFCSTCRSGKTSVVRLSAETWQLLNRLSRTTDRDDASASTAGGEVRPAGEIRQFMNNYISHHLGYQPRLHKYITGIKD
jgi:DNA repair protein RecO (recombination protein O)